MVLEKLGRRDQFAGGICQSELWSRLARPQGVLGCRNLSPPIEDEGNKQASDEDTDRAKYGPADFTPVVLLVAKSPLKADGEQCSADQKQSVVNPWYVARAGKHRKNRDVACDGCDNNQKPEPNEEVKTRLHRPPHLHIEYKPRISKCPLTQSGVSGLPITTLPVGTYIMPWMATHPSDADLERYCLGMIQEGSELGALEGHLLICGECVDRAQASDTYIDSIRAALVRRGFWFAIFAWQQRRRRMTECD